MAIYNDNIVDLRFPLALYKKLLRQSVDLGDLKELSPTVGQSMDRVLTATEEDAIEDWGLTFSIERTEFDMTNEVPFVPGGEHIPVTFVNRKKYVETYIDYVFNISSKDKYRKFEDVSSLLLKTLIQKKIKKFLKTQKIKKIQKI